MIVTAWRIVQERFARNAFDGDGARRFPGRWNEAGTPMMYTAGSLSLAALELLVHLDSTELLGRYVSIPLRFDASLARRPALADIPDNWAEHPPPQSTRAFGTAWAAGGSSAVLAVPSAVVPVETLYLLHPLHPDFQRIEIGAVTPFPADPRLQELQAAVRVSRSSRK